MSTTPTINVITQHSYFSRRNISSKSDEIENYVMAMIGQAFQLLFTALSSIGPQYQKSKIYQRYLNVTTCHPLSFIGHKARMALSFVTF